MHGDVCVCVCVWGGGSMVRLMLRQCVFVPHTGTLPSAVVLAAYVLHWQLCVAPPRPPPLSLSAGRRPRSRPSHAHALGIRLFLCDPLCESNCKLLYLTPPPPHIATTQEQKHFLGENALFHMSAVVDQSEALALNAETGAIPLIEHAESKDYLMEVCVRAFLFPVKLFPYDISAMWEVDSKSIRRDRSACFSTPYGVSATWGRGVQGLLA